MTETEKLKKKLKDTGYALEAVRKALAAMLNDIDADGKVTEAVKIQAQKVIRETRTYGHP